MVAKKRRGLSFGYILFFLSLILNIFLGYMVWTNKKSNEVFVVGVYDGDTIILENKTRLRLRQLDSPELDLCGGKEARDLLQSLVGNKTVKIEEQIPDQNGRAMALIYSDGTLVNEVMLSSGWARYHSDKTSKTEVLKSVSDLAKGEKRGIYSSLCLKDVNTENPNCIIKGNITDRRVKSGRKLYYLPNCAQYKFVQVEEDLGERWFCTEKEAISAGYTKAETCR